VDFEEPYTFVDYHISPHHCNLKEGRHAHVGHFHPIKHHRTQAAAGQCGAHKVCGTTTKEDLPLSTSTRLHHAKSPRGAPPCGSTTSHLEILTFVWMQWKTVTKGVMLTTGNHKAFLTYWPLQVLCNRHEHAFSICSILHMLRHLQRLVCPTNNDLVTRRMQAVASFPFLVAAD